MDQSEIITLDCPYCRVDIRQPLAWFKQAYFTCPACGGGLTEGQFAGIVADLEAAFDASIDEMLQGRSGCNCGSGGCG